jgi:hypothetical protein
LIFLISESISHPSGAPAGADLPLRDMLRE